MDTIQRMDSHEPVTMWTTQEAIQFIRTLHPAAFAAGWNLHLGGGLATKKDTSDKDADILLMPRAQTKKHNIEEVCQALTKLGWTAGNKDNSLPHRDIRSFHNQTQTAELIFVIL